MAGADEFPMVVKNYHITCYYQQGFFDGRRWRRSPDGDRHIAVCKCGRAVVADSIQEAVDKLHDSYVILVSGKHSHGKGTIAIPEYQILRRHAGLIIRYGRSSEDQTWWAEAREGDGRFITGTSSRRTLQAALRILGTQCDRRKALMVDPASLGLKENPTKPDDMRAIRYGGTVDLEPGVDDEEE